MLQEGDAHADHLPNPALAPGLSSAWPYHSLGARDGPQRAAEPGDPAAAGGDGTARAIAVTAPA